MRRAGSRVVIGLGVTVVLSGCNLIFDVGDPALVEQGGEGGSATGSGGQPQGSGGEAPSCVGVVCDDGNLCTSEFCGEGAECGAIPNDAATPEQLPGDCLKRACSGGVLQADPDDTDVPADDQNPCTQQMCAAGSPGVAFQAAGYACNGLGTCDGAGLCSMCTVASQCGLDTECAKYTCNGQCGAANTPAGPTQSQVPSDCKESRCTGGSAAAVLVPLDDDIEDDFNDCTLDKCAVGSPVHPPLDGGSSCSNGVCNGQGLCVKCFDGSQCVGNPYGEACLGTWQCGCKSTVDCRGKFGSACLATEECGCLTDADCNLPGAAGRYCNLAQNKCSPPLIEEP